MLKLTYSYFSTIPAVFIDGAIYVLLAISATWAAALTSDIAHTLMGPVLLFWVSSTNASAGAALLALKMFRSTAFADHQQNKKDAAQVLESAQAASVLQQQTPTQTQ
jgi:hypothetical protein